MKKRKEINITLSPETANALFRCIQETLKKIPKDIRIDDLVYFYCLLSEYLPKESSNERMAWLLKLRWLKLSPPRKRSVKK
jgi:hypothetical protein